jgi:hypothetical protein
MPVTTSFPGIYIEELPSNAHAITAAPTSVTVFVGYSHPFPKNPDNFGVPRELFSFSDYEREFGGFAYGNGLDNNLPYAVSQFFLNGGGDAVVVGLQPTGTDGGVIKPIPNPVATLVDNSGVQFTALQPIDQIDLVIDISPTATSVPADQGKIADIVVTYGTRQEVYRKVAISRDSADFIDTRINGVSSLVTVKPLQTDYAALVKETASFQTLAGTQLAFGFQTADFTEVFQADTPLDKWPLFNLLVTPGITDPAVLSEALAFCERKLAFFIMDPPAERVADPGTDWIGDYAPPTSQNGAIYFPYIQSNDPSSGAAVNLPPSGTVAGVFARTDNNRGVWKAPAGLETTILNTTGLVPSGVMTDPRQGTLNNLGINCLRSFPGIGTVVFGARTLVYPNTALRTQWGYVPVRRMALFLEQTLKLNLTWVVFEPNDDPLWIAIRINIESFMLSLFHQGAFAGATPSSAFQVKCDGTTTTQQDVDNGVVNIIVAFAPLKPAEFVIIKIGQLAGQAQV